MVKSRDYYVPSGRTPPGGRAVRATAFDPLAALQELDLGVLAVDADWRILFANQAWQRALGSDARHSVGAELWAALPALAESGGEELVRATAADALPRTLSVGRKSVRVTQLATGGVLLAVERNPIEAAENEELRRRAEDLLEQAQVASQAKSVFLATISHELRTPLTALTGYGELLADEIVGPLTQQQHEVLDRMRSVTHHLTAMIDELLAYTRLEGGRESVSAIEVSSETLIETTIAVVEPLARAKGLECIADVPTPVPTLVTDADKVRQILVNLASNAVKFTDEGGVTLGVRAEGDVVHFDVRDTGSGIAGEDQERLFQPFTQLDSGLTRRHGGTGLGLYISRRLALLLGGRLDCESSPGEGSVFTLTLPAR